MKILLVGVGGVGEAIAAISKPRPWLEMMVLADYNKERCLEVQEKLGDNKKFPVEWVDANKKAPHHKTVDALANSGLGLSPPLPNLALKTLPIFLWREA